MNLINLTNTIVSQTEVVPVVLKGNKKKVTLLVEENDFSKLRKAILSCKLSIRKLCVTSSGVSDENGLRKIEIEDWSK